MPKALSLLLLTAWISACGTTAYITGNVRDASGPPVPLATVYWWLPSDSLRRGPAATDSAGHFRITLTHKAGCYRLLLAQIGYARIVRTFRLATRSRDLGTFTIEQSPIPESPLHVHTGCDRTDTLPQGPGEYDTLQVAP